MLEAAPLLAVTCAFISTFLYFIVTLEIDEIRNNWDSKRCQPSSILFAQKIPTDPSIDKEQFAEDNFYFCLEKSIDYVLKRTLQPIFDIFKKQTDTVSPINDSINYLKSSASQYLNPLNSTLNSFNSKLNALAFESARISTRIKFAMQRINASITASIFAGISMYQGIQNSVQYVIRVCLIILGILVALVFFLWFVMFPFIPTILATISAISLILGSAAVGGMASAFCVAPNTLVAVSNNSWLPVSQLKPGDILRGGSIVEGVLHTTGKGAKCVTIDSILISACHLVFHENHWIPAENHPRALSTSLSTDSLYCLNTSDRKWIVKGVSSELILRDWEELPLNDQSQCSWESFVYSTLNTMDFTSEFMSCPGRGLLHPETRVFKKDFGPVPISSIQIGDFIKDSESSFTQVIGTYSDISGPTPSIWCYNGSLWCHPSTSISPSSTSLQLITVSGTFFTSKFGLVRDFTEIGWNSIDDSYSFTDSMLNSNSNS